MKQLRVDPRVTMHLLPLPKSRPSGVEKHGSEEISNPKGDPKLKAPKPKKPPTKKATALCPEELKGHHQRDESNENICWAFSLANGCKTKGNRCPKGVHKCAKCLRTNHGLATCRVAGKKTARKKSDSSRAANIVVEEQVENSSLGATSKGNVSQSSREVRPRTGLVQSTPQISQNSFFRFSGRPISELLVIEVFAGTARLSITAGEAGFRSLSVDKTCDRCTGAHIAIFGLTKREDVESLKQLIFDERFNIAWIHFAPACGTCSRARENKLPSLEAQGIAVPKPLRSDEEPLGVAGFQVLIKFALMQPT